jgi:excisionase family DNA binding protein
MEGQFIVMPVGELRSMITAIVEKALMHHREDVLLTIGDVQKMFGVHRNTVLNWVTSGKLTATRVGNRYRFRREDIDKSNLKKYQHSC